MRPNRQFPKVLPHNTYQTTLDLLKIVPQLTTTNVLPIRVMRRTHLIHIYEMSSSYLRGKGGDSKSSIAKTHKNMRVSLLPVYADDKNPSQPLVFQAS